MERERERGRERERETVFTHRAAAAAAAAQHVRVGLKAALLGARQHAESREEYSTIETQFLCDVEYQQREEE